MNKLLPILLLTMFFTAIGVSYYTYFYKKDFDLRFEAECDPAVQKCYTRNCETDYCPRDLADYRVFFMDEKDLDKCDEGNFCLKQCDSGEIKCREVPCNPDAGDACSTIKD